MAALYSVEQLAGSTEDGPVLTVKGFSFTYDGAASPAVAQADFTLVGGQISLLIGRSGSGKTTLLRSLKPPLAPHGKRFGEISFFGRDMAALSSVEGVADIGYLFQNPDSQILMETVYEELAFGLENLGLSQEEIRMVIGDTASFCGIDHLLDARTDKLSGGERQLVNLCALLCFRPKLLLLDEPFAQLDPENVRRILAVLRRLTVETGVAVLLSEQRLEEVWSLAEQVIYLEEGHTAFVGGVRDFLSFSREQAESFGLPGVSRLFARSGKDLYHLPLSFAEGQSLFAAWGGEAAICRQQLHAPEQESCLPQSVFSGKDISFAYPQKGNIVLKQISLAVHRGERLVICGSNGAGKTTLLTTMAGILKPLQGNWQVRDKNMGIGYLSQVVQNHFRYDTPHEEFYAIEKGYRENQAFWEIIQRLGVDRLLRQDIYTLSVGQQQRVALVMTLARSAALYLLDEPTRGLDEKVKQALGEILQGKVDSGVVFATHDLEFAADFGNRFAALCCGRLSSPQDGAAFFTGRHWQTTAGAKLFPGLSREYGWYAMAQIPDGWGSENHTQGGNSK